MDEMDEVFESVARYFSMLADPARLHILHVLCQNEASVGEIVVSSAMTQTNVSLGLLFGCRPLARRHVPDALRARVGRVEWQKKSETQLQGADR